MSNYKHLEYSLREAWSSLPGKVRKKFTPKKLLHDENSKVILTEEGLVVKYPMKKREIRASLDLQDMQRVVGIEKTYGNWNVAATKKYIEGTTLNYALFANYENHINLFSNHPYLHHNNKYFHFDGKGFEETTLQEIPKKIRREMKKRKKPCISNGVENVLNYLVDKEIIVPEIKPHFPWSHDNEHILYEGKPITTKQTVQEELKKTMQEIHSRGYACLDIRSCNILLNKEGEPHLFDFDWVYKKPFIGKRFFNTLVAADKQDLESLFINTGQCVSIELHAMPRLIRMSFTEDDI